jgi:hypothetical protein
MLNLRFVSFLPRGQCGGLTTQSIGKMEEADVASFLILLGICAEALRISRARIVVFLTQIRTVHLRIRVRRISTDFIESISANVLRDISQFVTSETQYLYQ